jgi:hemerythrin
MRQSTSGGAGELLGFFEIGFEPMDELHRQFRELVLALAAPEGGNHGEALLALHEHLLRHCALEEQWMKDSDFPSCACHRQEHEMLLEVVAEVRRRFDAGDLEVVQRLAEELPRCFEVHANTMDAALAFHLHDRARAAADQAAQTVGALAGL